MEATMLNARRLAIFCLTIVPALTGVSARAAEYPVRPIKLVVPYAPGGPTDVLGRLVADFLARDLKVMDASAVSLSRENRIPIIVFAIHTKGNLAAILRGAGRCTVIGEAAVARVHLR